jgi:DNA-binding PadR family transcriptional regulator
MGPKTSMRTGRGGALLSPADREIRFGIWKIHILFHAAKRAVWGGWLLHELAAHGHDLSPGTLYPALARMKRNGWLKPSNAASHAHDRTTYRITPAGRRLLAALREEVAELYEEVVLEREPVRGREAVGRRSRKPRRRTP